MYEKSGIDQRVWLVGVEGLDCTDTGSSSLYGELYDATDGTSAGLHSLRDEYHADLVLFFAAYSPSSCSGLAWIQTHNNNVGWKVNGF